MIENFGVVISNARAKNFALPRVCGSFTSLKLSQNLQSAAFSKELGSRCDVLPAQQPADELRRGHRLDLLAHSPEGEPMDARQQSAIAPFDLLRVRIQKISAQCCAGRFKPQKCLLNLL